MHHSFSPLVLQGSSHIESNTQRGVTTLFSDSLETIFLCQKTIYPYGHFAVQEDDFLPIIRRMHGHNPLIFATPIYWYNMSGLMKTFFDRMGDVLKTSDGYALQGKTVIVTASSAHEKPSYFDLPFEDTFAYLHMHYAGCFHLIMPETADVASYNQSTHIRARELWQKLQSIMV